MSTLDHADLQLITHVWDKYLACIFILLNSLLVDKNGQLYVTIQHYRVKILGGSGSPGWSRHFSRSDFVVGKYSFPKSDRYVGKDCKQWNNLSLCIAI